MATSDILNSMKAHILDAYDAIEEAGGVIPENKNIENMPGAIRSIILPDLSTPLDKAGLDKLQSLIRDGKASELLNLGDELLVSYGSYTMPFEIVGFEDVEVAGGSKVHAINLLAKYTNQTTTAYGTTSGIAYSVSTLRSAITGSTYQGALDANFVACLAQTKTQTYSRDGSTDVVYDKLFAPSMAQLGVTNTNYNSADQAAVEGPAFTSYQDSSNADRVRRGINATTTAKNYWTRTNSWGNSSRYNYIHSSGTPANANYDTANPVVVACNLAG